VEERSGREGRGLGGVCGGECRIGRTSKGRVEYR